MASSRRRNQFLPDADGTVRIAGKKVDVRSLEDLSVFPELQSAVATDDVERTKALLDDVEGDAQKKELLNQADKDGFRLLHRACALGSVQLMNVLMDAGADPNARDNCGDAPMHWACFSGNLDAVEALLKGGGDPLLASSDGKTPLDAALEEKHTHILQLLFSYPWNVYDTRAILESVLLRGPLFVKVSSRLVASRRVWRPQHIVLSTMMRALFIYKSKDMTDSPNDCEHICFQDILAVKWQNHTQKRYTGRRFNVYARLDDISRLKFNFTSSGMDSLILADYAEEKGGDEVISHGSQSDESEEEEKEEEKSGFGKRLMRSFRRPRGNSQPNVPGSETQSGVKGRKSSEKNTERYICIAFLCESSKEAKKWVDAFRQAGTVGKTLPCVRIQTCWRRYQAQEQLKRLKGKQIQGSEVAARRGTNVSKRFIPLDASKMVESSTPATAMTIVSKQRSTLVNQLLNVGTKRRMTNIGRSSASASTSSPGIELPKSIKGRKTTAVALPVEDPLDTAEDKAGYLKKRSETGVSGALRLWKSRFIIISHTKAEIQYFNPKRRPPRIHRIAFKDMLSVKPVEKDKDQTALALRVIGGSTYRFQATTTTDRDVWIAAFKRVLPRENVAALQIQRVVRGFLARKRVKQLRYLALQRAMQKRDEALVRIEEARQRAAAELEARASKEEAALLLRLQEEEREHRRRVRAAKKRAQQEVALMDRPLPAGWKQYVDKRTGRVYYFHKETKTTTWTRPETVDERQLPQPAVHTVDEYTGSEDSEDDDDHPRVQRGRSISLSSQGENRHVSEQSTRDGAGELPSNWRELHDPKSGEIYYFNTITHESTWTRPSNTPRKSPWSKRFDPASGHYYYYDERTGASQWELPEDFVDEEDQEKTPMIDTESNLVAKSEITAGKKKRSAVEKDREAGSDQSRVSPTIKASPTPFAKAASSPATKQDTIKQSITSDKTSPTTQTLKSLEKALEKTTAKRTRADHWQRFTDAKSGTPYYVNTSTGEKTWIKPAVLGGPRSKKEAWIALKDDRGREYFNNSITGESVWVLPVGEKLASEVDNDSANEELVMAFTRHIDGLLSSFPARSRKMRYEDEGAPGEASIDWSLLDEEDDPVHYVGLHEKGGLFETLKSGLLLCRLVNRIVPDTIDPRAMNIDVDTVAATATRTEEQDHAQRLARENLSLFLGALRAVGGQPTEACTPEMLMGAFPPGVADLVDSDDRRVRVLEVVWETLQLDLLMPITVTNCRPLLNLMDSTHENVQEFESLHESEKLLRWLAFHAPRLAPFQFGTRHSPELIAAGLCSALWAVRDSRLPTSTIPVGAKQLFDDPSSTLDESSKADLFDRLAEACRALGIARYASRAECLRSSDPRLQVACCATVFAQYHNLPVDVALSEDEQNELRSLTLDQDTDESRDERILRTWINSLNIRLEPGSNAPTAVVSPKSRSSSSKIRPTLRIKNLFFDLRDGVVLLHVFNSMQPKLNVFGNYNKIHLRPENKFHMLENASVIIDLAKSTNLSVVNLGPFDIVDGNRKLVLGLAWQMMRYASVILLESIDTTKFMRWKASPNDAVTDADVLNWANDKVRFGQLQRQTSARSNSVKFIERPLVLTEVSMSKEVDTVDDAGSDDASGRYLTKRSSLRSSLKRSSLELVKDITSFKDPSLRTGCFLLTLINAIRPGVVNWKHAVQASAIDMSTTQGLEMCEKNAKYVLSLAFKLGCSVFLSWEDIVELKSKALFIFVVGLIVLDAKSGIDSPKSPSSPATPGL